MIEYIVSNRNIHPLTVLHVKNKNSANVGSDHSLVVGKFRLKMRMPERYESISK